MSNIHPTAIIEKGAELGVNVEVGPYSIVGAKVKLHDGVKVHSHVVISGRTTVGENTQIFPFSAIGCEPQDLKFKGEDTRLTIGKNNKIREHAHINIGTEGGGGLTSIGDDNLIMAFCHIAHDCIVNNHCIFANSINLAGHVIVEDRAFLGGLAGIHQFCRIGQMAMIAGGSMVAQDVPPFCMVQGDRATINGLNVVGLRRSQIDADKFSDVKKMYRLIYRENLTLEEAIIKIDSEISESPYKASFVNFLKKSERGICR